MQKNKARALAVLMGASCVVGGSVAIAAPTPSGENHSDHDLSHPLGDKQRAARQQAIDEIMANGGTVYGKTHQIANGQYVELERQSEDPIWTVLGEFGTLAHPVTGGGPGPLHNEILPPNRAEDNITHWMPDFDVQHYETMLFDPADGANSMRNFYIEQSSGRYAVYGVVEDWVTVPFNANLYGHNLCGNSVCAEVWYFVQHAVGAWYQQQLQNGMTAEEIDEYLSQYDVWDRYDHDGDGNFDEPDGYIDHFQAVHAGEGEEAGGGAQGEFAIWSHRWYVQLTPVGADGPTVNGQTVPLGGTQIGNSKYWIGDYTIEPENGGLGVFAHEFAHDHGLPDLYDTSGGGSNSVQFWSLMSAGSWLGAGGEDIGTAPAHMGAWEKLQLGWLNYEVAFADTHKSIKVGPSHSNTKQAQAVIVVLPDKEVNNQIAEPFAGDHFFYSGAGNNLDAFLYQTVQVDATTTSMTAMVNYDIESDWDYAYAGAYDPVNDVFHYVPTNLSTTDDPNGQNFGNGITGASGGWVSLTADLTSLPPGTYFVGFRYWTDGYVVNPGFMVDDWQIAGYPVDGAEPGATTASLAGFSVTTGAEQSFHPNYYIAEYRQHVSWDDGLRTGPYNFGFLGFDGFGNLTGTNWVEHFPYQEGLLVSYWDTSQTDNNTSQHPGEGLILPVDAHPGLMTRSDPTYGPIESVRVHTFDSTFSLDPTDELTLHWFGVPTTYASQPGQSVFDDNNQYYNPQLPTAGVINPQTDTQITIVSTSAQDSFMQIHVD